METTSFACPECSLNLHVTENGPFCLGCGWNIEGEPRSEFPYLSTLSQCPECSSMQVAVSAPRDFIDRSNTYSRSRSVNVRIHPLSLSYVALRPSEKDDTANHNECLKCHLVWSSNNPLADSIELLEAVQSVIVS
jgi:hypothetical protein